MGNFMIEASAEDVHAFCKYIIGGMAGFIVLAGGAGVAWIKALIEKNGLLQNDRISDLKENYKHVKKD